MTRHDPKLARPVRDDREAGASADASDLLAGMPAPRAKSARGRRTALLSFFLLVVAPFLLASGYWLAVASDRYLAGAGFAVRSMTDNAGGDMLGSLTGLVGSTGTTSDTGIVLRFLESRDLIERVMEDVDLRSAFGAPSIDPLYRLQTEDAPIEEIRDYWRSRISITHDATTGLVNFNIEAFSAEDALAIATSVLSHVEDLVNRVSAEARREVLRASESELDRAEARLREASAAQRRFREENRELNPLASAGEQTLHVADVEQRLSATRRRIALLERQIEDDSPQLTTLRHEEASLVEELAAIRARSGERAELVEAFEATELEKHLAQEAYASTLASLQAARVRADSAQRYLAVFHEPQLAQSPELPRRGINVALSLVALVAIWSIAALVTRHIGDKLR